MISQQRKKEDKTQRWKKWISQIKYKSVDHNIFSNYTIFSLNIRQSLFFYFKFKGAKENQQSFVQETRNLQGQFNYHLNSQFIIITSMKHTHLSNFQKQQYTAYLQAQLQKFSVFMLSQKKENQKYRFLEQGLSSQADIIDHLQSKMQMSQAYQRETLENLDNLSRKYQHVQDMQNRLRRLEDRERFDCDRQARKKQQMIKREGKSERQNQGKERNVDPHYSDIIRRLKKIQEELYKQKETPLSKFSSADSFDAVSLLEEGTTKKLKKMEKKMKKYFNDKFQEIQSLVKRSKKNKSKSPTARTPIEMSTMSYYQIDKVEKPLSQFRLDDRSVNKSDLSTILRESKNTITSNKLRTPMQSKKHKPQKQKQNTKNSRSKSKSKSKNKLKQKSKSKNKKQSRSISKSKSRKIDRSQSLSDNSFLHSQLSKSKSIVSKKQIKELKKQKKIKQKSQKRSISKSRSHHSSISLHQKCKKRPEYEVYLTNNAKSKQKKYVSQKNHNKKN